MKTMILMSIFVSLSAGCVTIKDHGDGSYSVGLGDSSPTKSDPAKQDDAPQHTKPKAPVDDTSTPTTKTTPAQKAVRVEAVREVVNVETVRARKPVPPRIDTDDEQTFATVVFPDLQLVVRAAPNPGSVALHATVTTTDGAVDTFEIEPDPDNFGSCDETSVEVASLQPGLLTLGLRCFVEGGDNNYENWWVGLTRHSENPTTPQDFEVLWSGNGSSFVSGYYEDTTVKATFVVRDDGIYRIEETREGCEAGVNYEAEEGEEPCVPQTTRAEAKVAN